MKSAYSHSKGTSAAEQRSGVSSQGSGKVEKQQEDEDTPPVEGGERLNSNERAEMIFHQTTCTTAAGKSGTHLSASLFSSHLQRPLCHWWQLHVGGLGLISNILITPFGPCCSSNDTCSPPLSLPAQKVLFLN